MKILQIITLSELGGAQSHVLDLLRGYKDRHEIHLATSTIGPLTEAATQMGLPVHIVKNLKRQIDPRTDLQAIRECIALFRQLKPDIIHAHSSKAGLVARIAAAYTKTPIIFTAHGWGFTPRTPPIRRAIALISEWLVASIAKHIICVSQADYDLAQKYKVGNVRQLAVVRYGIPAGKSLANPSQTPPRFIMVARFNEQKDHLTLFHALRLLGSSAPEFWLVGNGPDFLSRKSLAIQMGIDQHLQFLGDRQDVADLLAQAQCFVLSTHYEGLPISILEAMRSGLPVIATAVNGIPEEVIHEQTGLLFNHEDAQQLATAISKLTNDASLRVVYGANGHQLFLREFTEQGMLDRIESLYLK